MAAKEVPRSALKFVVFLGTVREGNYGSRAGKLIVRKLNEKGFQVNYLGKSVIAVSRLCHGAAVRHTGLPTTQLAFDGNLLWEVGLPRPIELQNYRKLPV
jgi:hypothetical protein